MDTSLFTKSDDRNAATAPPVFMILSMANAIAVTAMYINDTSPYQKVVSGLTLYLWTLGLSSTLISLCYYRFSVSYCIAMMLYLFPASQLIMLTTYYKVTL